MELEMKTMKYLIITVFILSWLVLFAMAVSKPEVELDITVPPKGSVQIKVIEPTYTFDDLLDAIEWVESRGKADARGDAFPACAGDVSFCEGTVWFDRAKQSPKCYDVVYHGNGGMYITGYDAIGA